jgi:hypothetical protein
VASKRATKGCESEWSRTAVAGQTLSIAIDALDCETFAGSFCAYTGRLRFAIRDTFLTAIHRSITVQEIKQQTQAEVIDGLESRRADSSEKLRRGLEN